MLFRGTKTLPLFLEVKNFDCLKWTLESRYQIKLHCDLCCTALKVSGGQVTVVLVDAVKEKHNA